MRLQSEHLGRIAFSRGEDEEALDAYLRRSDNGKVRVEFLALKYEWQAYHEVLYGVFNGLGEISLFDCHLVSNSINSPGYNHVIYTCSLLIKDHDFRSEKELLFKECSFDLTNYSEWFRIRIYDFVRSEDKTRHFKFNEYREIDLFADINISGILRIGANFSLKNFDSFTFSQSVYLNLVFHESVSIDRIVQLKNRVGQIIMLLSGKNRTVSICNAKGVSDKWYDVYKADQKGVRDISSFDRYTYRDIENDFGSYLMNWITHPTFPSIGDLLLARYNNRYTDLEQEYLSSCFALESIHRRLFPDSVRMDPDVFKENMSQLKEIDQLDAEFVEVLRERNKFGYELSFRNRIRELNKELTSTTNQLSEDDIHKIVTQRNALVHQLEDELIEGFEFIKYTRIIDNLVRDFLLKRLLSEA